MEPDHYKFGGGVTESILHPVVVVGMLLTIVLMFRMQRKAIVVPFLWSTFLIPAGQQFVIASVHVFVFRIIVVAGLIRMAWFKVSTGKRVLAGSWNSVDTAITLCVLFHVLAFIALYQESAAIVNQIGLIWDMLGAYFLLRFAIQDENDTITAIKCFVGLVIVFAACMIREQFTGQNIFGLLGGVRLIDEIRFSRIRSEAVFQHAILAGTFGATLLPLFVCLWPLTRSKLLPAIGVCASMVMTLTTACSTPLLGFAGGVFAILLWPLRRWTRWMRWGLVLGLLMLNLVMHAPVWYLIAHVGVVNGSSTDHRAELVDTFVRHFQDWWLFGAKSNASWGYEMFDTSNQYVSQGVTGGLLSLVFLILTISWAFAKVGQARRVVAGRDRRSELLFWLLGCAIFANTIAFFGISYFDQTRVAWLTLLAIVGALTKRKTPNGGSIARRPADTLAQNHLGEVLDQDVPAMRVRSASQSL
jgi:hypothetical protein